LFFVLQYSLWQGFLGWFFARTLRPGRTPLVTTFARIFHGGDLPAPVARYGRQVTWIWAIAFFAMVLISALLYVTASVATWSFFANVLYFPILLGLFGLEYLVRRIRFPDMEHASLFKSLQLYWDNQKKSKAAEAPSPQISESSK
jgi:uncharacterized membrane protein